VPTPDDGFRPRHAVVTGAESGIGRATAVALARDGLDVGITWFTSQEEAERTAAEVESHGVRAVTAYLDTTDLARAGDVVDELAETLGGLDVFVNSAGTGVGGRFLEVSVDSWRRTIATNLDGAFVCLQRAAQRMVEQGCGGRLIAVTSVHEHAPGLGSGPYAASKHGLGGLMKCIALELAQEGITANCVAPGEIATAMNGMADRDPRTVRRPGIPLGRPGDAREVADVISFLASARADYITGVSWAVDGGMLQLGPQVASMVRDDG
jgi:NAD(P)-dependent dehydrogenase (short-subunit alcohol dehydrogenase family)